MNEIHIAFFKDAGFNWVHTDLEKKVFIYFFLYHPPLSLVNSVNHMVDTSTIKGRLGFVCFVAYFADEPVHSNLRRFCEDTHRL